MQSKLLIVAGAFLVGFAIAATDARGSSVTYNILANGTKEVNAAGTPGQGDLDGTVTGTLQLDNGTGAGTTGSATFNLTLSNIDLTTLSGHHIHQAPATTTGSIVIDFGDPDTIRSGNLLSGTITGLPAATISNAFANPTGFYYNIHNGAFPGGAVRDQLPEPGSAALVALGGLSLLARRRRRDA
jgi:CHRD domain-containing protein